MSKTKVWSRRDSLRMIFFALTVTAINYAIYPILNLTFLVVVVIMLLIYVIPLTIFILVFRSRRR